MPCCCKDNVQASFVIGIVLAILSLINCVEYSPLNIALGIVGALIHCILIFGAYKRHRTAILGKFKTFFSPFLAKIKGIVSAGFVLSFFCLCTAFLLSLCCLFVVLLLLFCCLSVNFLLLFCWFFIAFLLLFSCLLEIERKQKYNMKPAKTILSIFLKIAKK